MIINIKARLTLKNILHHGFVSCHVNGCYMDGVISADSLKGVVIVHQTDSDGNVLLNRDRDAVATKTLYGPTVIKWSPSVFIDSYFAYLLARIRTRKSRAEFKRHIARAKKTYVVGVKVAWWFKYFYFPMIVITAYLIRSLGGNPVLNEKRLEYWVKKAVKLGHVEVVEK